MSNQRETRMITDIERLDWLQDRGRVKARKYGNADDNFTWDCTQDVSLREAINEGIARTAGEPNKAKMFEVSQEQLDRILHQTFLLALPAC